MRAVFRTRSEAAPASSATDGALSRSYLSEATRAASNDQARQAAERAASRCEKTLQANPPTPLFLEGATP